MSSQQEFNENYQQYILYYCNFIQSDPVIYNTDLSQICTVAYNFPPTQLMITSWLLSYAKPSNTTLLTFNMNVVLNWFDNYYNKPLQITSLQPFKVSSQDLQNVRVDNSMSGFIVYNLTTKSQYIYNGSSWISLNDGTSYLPVNSDIDLTNHSINNVLRLNQSNPSYLSILSTSSTNISFTANVSRAIDLPVFSGSSSSDFIFNSNGKITYSGSTRWFQVSVNYSVTSLVPLSVQTLTTYVSKNASTVITGPRNIHSFILVVGLNYVYSETINTIIQLSNTNSLQLFGNYTSSAGVTFNNISYSIAQI